MSSATKPFSVAMRDRQLQWALDGGVPSAALQERKGKPFWVLKSEHRSLNLFRSDWWDYIAGSEHRWASALNSSQCFGVNLFAPLADDSVRAKRFLGLLISDRKIEQQDRVAVRFEHTPNGAPEWLGERGQPTQVDVFFEITRAGDSVGFVLVEVKFTESSFGSCRGWNGKHSGMWTNPNRARCQNAAELVRSPQTQCWLAEAEGRRYWEILSRPSSSLRMDQIGHAGACPFRHGLYQMMRNRVMADELSSRVPGTWTEFVVCRHPHNDVLSNLKEPIAGSGNAFEAFRTLSSVNAVRDWNAEELVGLVGSTDDDLSKWKAWMNGRYFSL